MYLFEDRILCWEPSGVDLGSCIIWNRGKLLRIYQLRPRCSNSTAELILHTSVIFLETLEIGIIPGTVSEMTWKRFVFIWGQMVDIWRLLSSHGNNYPFHMLTWTWIISFHHWQPWQSQCMRHFDVKIDTERINKMVRPYVIIAAARLSSSYVRKQLGKWAMLHGMDESFVKKACVNHVRIFLTAELVYPLYIIYLHVWWVEIQVEPQKNEFLTSRSVIKPNSSDKIIWATNP